MKEVLFEVWKLYCASWCSVNDCIV